MMMVIMTMMMMKRRMMMTTTDSDGGSGGGSAGDNDCDAGIFGPDKCVHENPAACFNVVIVIPDTYDSHQYSISLI